MNPHVYSIEELFAQRIFTIPDYQRGYAWEKKHCEDLLEDLELLPEGFHHYTGTVVLHLQGGHTVLDREGNQYERYDIVDGQQRLTSIVLLLHSIQRALASSDTFRTLAEGVQKKFLFASRLVDENRFFKLALNADSAAFFTTILSGQEVVGGPTIRSHARLATAKQTFDTFLANKRTELGDEAFYPWLVSFNSKITHRLRVGIYQVDNAAEVGVIFEVMNNRGKDLTELEKVKNYLLYLSTKINLPTRGELATAVNSAWSAIYTRFMSAGFGGAAENEFLRAHWLMYYDYMRRNWEGSSSIKGAFSLKAYQGQDGELFNALIGYVASLDDAAIAYADLEYPARDDAFNGFSDGDRRRVVFWSKKLKRLGTTATFRPLLIACRLQHPADGEKYLELVQLIEKFAFRVYAVGGWRSDAGASGIVKLGYELYNGVIDFVAAVQRLKGIIIHYSPTPRFNASWDFKADDNDWYQWSALKYFLYEYEEHLAAGGRVSETWEDVSERQDENSVEHILPQTYEDPENYWPQRFTADERDIYLHDLGNLCLTYNNSSYKNFSFPRKKGVAGQPRPCYANSSLRQERNLCAHDDWTVATINERRSILNDWARERWRVDVGEAQNIVIELQGESEVLPFEDA